MPNNGTGPAPVVLRPLSTARAELRAARADTAVRAFGSAVDALAHLRDRPRYCPQCGASLADGIVVEYWQAQQRIFHSWCGECNDAFDIAPANTLIGVETEH